MEITSYATWALALDDYINNYALIQKAVRFLLKQRNRWGWGSTADTSQNEWTIAYRRGRNPPPPARQSHIWGGQRAGDALQHHAKIRARLSNPLAGSTMLPSAPTWPGAVGGSFHSGGICQANRTTHRQAQTAAPEPEFPGRLRQHLCG